MTSRIYNVDAIVLRRINLGETDKIVTLFTREKGKLGAVAKGARRPASRLSGATEIFGHVHALLAVGRTLDVLTQAEVRDAFPAIRSSLEKIAAASYLIELADVFTEERHPSPELFDMLLGGLNALCGLDDVALLVPAYAMHVLAEAGYHPSLSVCSRCGGSDDPLVGFSPSMGGAVCRGCRMAVKDSFSVAAESLEAAGALLARPLPQAARLSMSPRARTQALRIVRALLLYHTERPLKSARFLDELLAAKKLADGTE